MHRYVLLLPLVALTATAWLGACANDTVRTSAKPVGADADAHGCHASAGYAWCAHTQRCERPWELAQQKNFALSEANVARYCSSGSTQ